jgi:hypothetical protein
MQTVQNCTGYETTELFQKETEKEHQSITSHHRAIAFYFLPYNELVFFSLSTNYLSTII